MCAMQVFLIYAVAARVVKTGRLPCVKPGRDHHELLNRVITILKGFSLPPV